MYIFDVVPLTKIPRGLPDVLSYYSSEPVPIGSWVQVTFRNKKVTGIVLGATDLRSRKLDLKKAASFQLKKIEKKIDAEHISFNRLALADFISKTYFASLGASLKSLLPQFLGKKGYDFQDAASPSRQKTETRKEYKIIDFSRRSQIYEELLTPYLRSNRQVFICVPDTISGLTLERAFSKFNPLFVTGGASNKVFHAQWQTIVSGAPSLIIGTRVALGLPFRNLGLVLVDEESGFAHVSDMTPRIHGARVCEKISELAGADLITTDFLPTLQRYHKGAREIPVSRSAPIVADMAWERSGGNRSIFCRDIQLRLDEIGKLGRGKAIFFVPRLGYAPRLVCSGCDRSLSCQNCTSMLVLYRDESSRETVRCHHCGYRAPRPSRCPFCKAYGLSNRGLGLDKVAASLAKDFNIRGFRVPEIYKMSSELESSAAAVDQIDRFRASGYAVLVGTQSLLACKGELTAPFLGLLHADALAVAPDFQIDEKVFRTITGLRHLADTMIIQSHNPEFRLFKMLDKPNDFFDSELSMRERFDYPPYTRFVLLTTSDANQAIARDSAVKIYTSLQDAIRIWKIPSFTVTQPYPRYVSKERGTYRWSILIKAKNHDINGNSAALRELVSVVPPGWMVEADPQSII